MSTCEHIAQRATQVPVCQLCRVLRVASAAYYAWPRALRTCWLGMVPCRA